MKLVRFVLIFALLAGAILVPTKPAAANSGEEGFIEITQGEETEADGFVTVPFTVTFNTNAGRSQLVDDAVVTVSFDNPQYIDFTQVVFGEAAGGTWSLSGNQVVWHGTDMLPGGSGPNKVITFSIKVNVAGSLPVGSLDPGSLPGSVRDEDATYSFGVHAIFRADGNLAAIDNLVATIDVPTPFINIVVTSTAAQNSVGIYKPIVIRVVLSTGPSTGDANVTVVTSFTSGAANVISVSNPTNGATVVDKTVTWTGAVPGEGAEVVFEFTVVAGPYDAVAPNGKNVVVSATVSDSNDPQVLTDKTDDYLFTLEPAKYSMPLMFENSAGK